MAEEGRIKNPPVNDEACYYHRMKRFHSTPSSSRRVGDTE